MTKDLASHSSDLSFLSGGGEEMDERRRAEATWTAIERAKAEEALRQSEVKYRALFDSFDEGYCLVEIIRDENDHPFDMRYIELNKSFERQTGLHDAQGKTHSDLGLKTEPHWFEKYGQVARTGSATRFESYHQPTGRWYNVFVSPVESPHSDRVALVFDDVTERKLRARQQEFLLKLADALRPLSDAAEIEATACRLLGEQLAASRVYYPEVNEVLSPLLRNGPVVVADIYHSNIIPFSDLAAMEALQVVAVIAVPLIKNGLILGTLFVTQDTPRVWEPEEIEFVRETLERMWLAAQRARAEEAMRASEEKLGTFVIATSEIVYEMSADWREMRYLEGKEFITSIKSPTGDWTQAYLPEDEKQRVWTTIEKAIETKSTFELEHRVYRLDGSIGWTFSRAIPLLDESGAIIKWFGTASDVTERHAAVDALRSSELTFRNLVENSPFGIYVVDADFRLYLVGAGAQKIFQNVDPLIGRDFAEVMRIVWPEPFATKAIDLFRHTLSTGEPYRSPRTVEQRADINEIESYDWKIERITLPDGRFGVVCHYYDLSERQEFETALRESHQREHDLREAAEEANRLKDEFLAIMSHELRNPLNVILGYSDIMARNEELTRSPQLQRMAEAIKRNALAQSKLVGDLLDLSRLRSGKLELNREVIPAMSAINNAVETVRADAESKQIVIETLASDESLLVEADRVRLEQIIWNLLNNSIKFTPAGGRITIELQKEDPQAAIVVTDNGQGIDSSFLPHVFELFRQADAATTRAHAGMGIGLAIAQRLVELHDGSIAVSSDGPGKGARFSVKLPLATEVHMPATKTALDTTRLDDLAILVVDDSEDTAEMLSVMLKGKGAHTQSAISPLEALRLLESNEFDVVLSDISMPEVDGYEFLRRLRLLPNGREVPVVALTGFGRDEDIKLASEAGFLAHITKPIDADNLAGILSNLPKKSSQRRRKSR